MIKLEDGVDPDTKEELERKLLELDHRIEGLKRELAKHRTAVGVPVEEIIYAE